jgi:hypothetical protein
MFVFKAGVHREHIVELLDSDEDNDIIDEYDNMTQQGNQLQHAPFQNYVV